MGTVLVGRDREMGVTRAAIASGLAGTGALVVLEGSAGLGRTALLQEVARTAQRSGMPTALARAAPGEATVDLDVARGLARSLGRPIPARAGSRATPGDVAAAADHLLEVAGPLGACLLVDDAHRADDPSLQVLLRLAMRLDDCPIVLVLTATDARRPALLERLRALPDAVLMPLSPLTAEESAGLTSAILPGATADVARTCHERTAGNPFLLTELLADLAGDPAAEPAACVPGRVRAVVAARMASLGPDATALARAVAVLGEDATLPFAGELAGLDRRRAEDAADTLVRASVVHPSLRFAEAMVGDAVGAAAEPFARDRLGWRAAGILAEHGAAAPRVARHLLDTAPVGADWAVGQLAAAAQEAMGSGDCRAAAMLLRRALAEPPATDVVPEVLSALAFAESRAGLPEAPARIAEALEVAATRDARAALHREEARLMWLSGRLADAVQGTERTLAEAEPCSELHGEVLAELLAVVSMHDLAALGERPVLAELLERARAGWVPDTPALAATLASVLPLVGADHRLVAPLADRALTEDIWRQDAPPHGLRPDFVIGGLLLADELAPAGRLVREGLALAAARQDAVSHGRWTYWLTMIEYSRGDLPGAIDAGMRAIDAADPTYGSWLGYTAATVAEAHLDRGETGAAERVLAMTEGRVAAEELYGMAVDLARARVLLVRGAAHEAAELAAGVGARLTAFGHRDGPLIVWRPVAAAAAGIAGNQLLSRRLVAEELAVARSTHARSRLGRALRAAGALHGPEHRVALLEEAVEVLARTPCRLAQAGAMLDLGLELHRRGDDREAREQLAGARELAEACGAPPLASAALAGLHATGAKPRRTARRGPAALTPAERRVAELAAAGLTNRAIGRELVISSRTVEWHLGHAYGKLGIASRRELRAALGDLVARRSAAAEPQREARRTRRGRSA